MSGGQCAKAFTTPMTALTYFTTTFPSIESVCNRTVASGIDFKLRICTTNDDFVLLLDSSMRQPPTTLVSGQALARPLIVYWQSSDLYLFPSEYASSLASVIKVSFGTTATTPSNNTTSVSARPPTDANNKGPSLSPGAIAGIAIGIGALIISSIVILLYLWRRRKQRQRLQHPDVPEMEGSSRGLKRFMGGKWRAETDGTSQPVEAGSTSVRIIPGPPVELDGTQRERDSQSHT